MDHEILGSGDKLFGSASREASGNGAVVGDFIFRFFYQVWKRWGDCFFSL